MPTLAGIKISGFFGGLRGLSKKKNQGFGWTGRTMGFYVQEAFY
jgi:hypothetical protein